MVDHGDDELRVQGAANRARNILKKLQEQQHRVQEEQQQRDQQARQDDSDAYQALTGRLQAIKSGRAPFSMQRLMEIQRLVNKYLAKLEAQAQANNPSNPYAQSQIVARGRDRVRVLLESLDPPPEVSDSAEFRELMELLAPAGAYTPFAAQTSFDRRSMLQNGFRKQFLARQVNEAIDRASKLAAQRAKNSAARPSADAVDPAVAAMTLSQMARYFRKKSLKGKKEAEAEAADVGVETDAVEFDEPLFTDEEVELFAQRALETMQALREEIAPQWSPDQQPWLVNQADEEVFGIVLAAIPQELFKQTEAYQQMQNLRSGEEVFTLRAADRTTEAAGRNRSE